MLATQPGNAFAEGKKLKILTSFLPVYCFTVNVAGDLAEVSNLLPPGAEPHDFQFSPREMKKLAGADMIVVNGLGLESWLDRVLRSAEGPKVVVEAAAGLKEELISGTSGEVAHAGEHQHTSAANPHIWLDPKLAAHAVTNILEAFKKADPANAAGYSKNAEEYLGKLEKLDAELKTGLATAKGQSIVTLHDAFPYFAKRYDLRVVGVIEKVADEQPSPKHLANLGRLIREEKVKVIFSEYQSSSRLAQRIGKDYKIPVAELNTLEAGPFTKSAYEDGMRQNLQVIQNCFK